MNVSVINTMLDAGVWERRGHISADAMDPTAGHVLPATHGIRSRVCTVIPVQRTAFGVPSFCPVVGSVGGVRRFVRGPDVRDCGSLLGVGDGFPSVCGGGSC